MLFQIIIVSILFQFIYYQPFGNWVFAAINDSRRRNNYIVLYQRLAVIIIFSIPGLIASQNAYLISWLIAPIPSGYIFMTLAICLAVILLNYVYLQKKDTSDDKLLLDYAMDFRSYYFINILSWTIYLAVYEYYLRGLLLFHLLDIYSVPIAFTLNVSVYVFLHVQKSREELIGSIPFGLLLCWITYASGSIIPAIIIHIVLALSHDVIAIKMLKMKKATEIRSD